MLRNYNNVVTRILISLVLGLPSYAVFALIRNFPFSQITTYAYVEYSLTATVAFFLIFEVQNLKSKKLNKYYNWETHPWKRLSIELVSSLMITILVVTACYSFLYLVIWDMSIFPPSIYLYVSLVFFVSLCFMAFVNAAPIITSWKSSLTKAETLEKEAVKAKLEALRTQLSPHFFFNNLSILNGLIDERPELAKDFIARLSEVFRYILKHKNDEVVPLQEELKFIEDYGFLLNTRFENKVEISIDGNTNSNQFIPPITLQQLIENAVKHNESSFKKPLSISVQVDNEKNVICVKNPLQEKKGTVPSTGIGLLNLKERFDVLTEREIEISNTDGEFQIKLPLLVKS